MGPMATYGNRPLGTRLWTLVYSAIVAAEPAGQGRARDCGGLLPTVPAPAPTCAAQGLLAGRSPRHTGQTVPRGPGPETTLWVGWWGLLATSARLLKLYLKKNFNSALIILYVCLRFGSENKNQRAREQNK